MTQKECQDELLALFFLRLMLENKDNAFLGGLYSDHRSEGDPLGQLRDPLKQSYFQVAIEYKGEFISYFLPKHLHEIFEPYGFRGLDANDRKLATFEKTKTGLYRMIDDCMS